ncbi:MAG: DUF1800 domain-containing protein [Acidobacteriota bacterium]|nr:DUF1800 domain-containing protein [Acidobacteriota bacterium]
MKKIFFREIRFGLSLLLLSLFVVEPLAAATDVNRKKTLSSDQRVEQVLARLTFGARPEDFERVKKIGVKAYIEQQLNPDMIDDSALAKRLEKLPTLMLAAPSLAEQYNPPKPPPTPMPTPILTPTPTPLPMQMSAPATDMATNAEMVKPNAGETPKPVVSAPTPKPTPATKNPQQVVTELQRAKLLRAVYSERQLNEVLVDFWENHFNIYSQKDADRWLLTGFDRDAIRPFVMGRFRDLLGATAHSPAMLFYLDNWQSSVVRKYPATKDKPERTSGGINENYARELMELHTLGVGGGYTQKDVQEVARCFTGWTIRKPNEEGVFIFNPQAHDNGEKTVLGQKIAAGGGIADAERVLDILAKHPSTAHFIAAKLARRFLGDNPPEAVVGQAAQAFLKTDGSIRETVRSIITSPAFLSPAMYQTKVKSPFEYAAASLRITGAETDANRPILDWISKMGQPIFGHVTPEGYPEKSSEWLSAGSLLERFNFVTALVQNKIKGTVFDPKRFLQFTDFDNPAEITTHLIRSVLHNEVSARSKAALDKVAGEAVLKLNADKSASVSANQNSNLFLDTKASPTKADAANKSPDYVTELVTLTLGSPEFQRK